MMKISIELGNKIVYYVYHLIKLLSIMILLLINVDIIINLRIMDVLLVLLVIPRKVNLVAKLIMIQILLVLNVILDILCLEENVPSTMKIVILENSIRMEVV